MANEEVPKTPLPSGDALREQIKLLEQARDLSREIESEKLKARKKDLREKTEILEALEKEERLLERKLLYNQNLSEDEKKSLPLLKERIKLLKLATEADKEAVDAIKDHEKALEELNKDGENFANTLIGYSGAMGNFTKKMMGTKGGFKAFSKGLLGLLNPFKWVVSFMMKVIEASVMMAVNMDKARAGFIKSSGAARKFGGEVTDLSWAMRGTGIRADEVAQAYGGLYSSFVDFTKATKSQRAALTKTVSKFQELGVSAELQAQIANEATRSLGFGFGEVEGVLRDVGGVAESLNEPFSKVMENFKTVATKLAFHGKNIGKVFQKLSAQAKATGLSMDELLGLVEQFDTFEGAGKAVGKLNAIMGGPYLNSIDMLNASEEERVEILQRSMKQAGMNFKDMGKYEQKMIAASMGVGVEQARKLFGGGETEQQKMERLKKSQLDARVNRAQDIAELMLNLVEKMALNWMPWLEKIRKAIVIVGDKIQELLTWFSNLSTLGKAKVLLGALIGSYVISKLPRWLLSGGKHGARAQLGLKPTSVPRLKPPKGSYWNAKAGRWVSRSTSQFVGGPGRFGKPSMWQRATGFARRATGLTGQGIGGLKKTGRIYKLFRALNPANWKMPRWMNPRNWRMPAWMNPANWKIPTFMNPAAWPRPAWLTKIIEVAMPAIRFGLGKLLVGLDAIFLVFDAWSNWTNKAQDNVDRIGKTVMSIVGAVGLIIGSIVSLPHTLVGMLGLAFAQALSWSLKKVGLGFLVAEGELNADTHGKNVFEQAWTAGRLGWEGLTGQGGPGSSGTIMFEGEKRSKSDVDAILKQRGVDDFIYRGDETGGQITPINKKDEFLGMKAGGAIQKAIEELSRPGGGMGGDRRHGQGNQKKAEPTVINLYVGKKKFDSFVLDALDTPEAMRRYGPASRTYR